MAFSEKFFESRQNKLQGKTTRERGYEKQLLALEWISRWGYSFPSVLDRISNVTARGLTAKLVRNGLVKTTKTASGGGLKDIPNQMLTLTLDGLRILENNSINPIEYVLDPYRIKQDQLRHYFIVQTSTMKAMNESKISSFQTEKEYVVFSKHNVKQPDAIWNLHNGNKMAIEVELTAKWGRKLDEFIFSSLKALKKQDDGIAYIDYFVIYSDSNALLERYKNAFEPGQVHSRWEKNNRGYWVQEGTFEVPNSISGKVICKKY